jgi:hypothetical protein
MPWDVYLVDLGALALVGFVVWYFRLLDRR